MRLAGLPMPLPFLFRALKAAAACLLFSHAAVFGQGAAAPPASPPASAAGLAATLPKTIPFKQDSAPASGEGSPAFAAVALVVVLGLAGAGLWAWRNRRPAAGAESSARRSGWWGGASSKVLVLHGTTRLSPRHSVHDIEWQGRRLLVGCTDQGMALLCERAAAAPVPPEDKP